MDKQLKKKWVEALRSGKYKQGRDRLKNKDGFCCLGVLCDILPTIDNKNKWTDDDRYIVEKGSYDTTLPDELRKTCGLKRKTINKLIAMNDKAKYTFKKIAAYISRNL